VNEDLAHRIAANPKYQELVAKRHSFAWVMTVLVMINYFGYILLVAFNKEWLATKLGAGMVTSVGIPLGVAVIVITIILTNIYVRRANTDFDDRTAELIKEVGKK